MNVHADKELFIFEDADKNCFQTSTTSTLLATAEPAMTTTVAFAGASFDHEHGELVMMVRILVMSCFT